MASIFHKAENNDKNLKIWTQTILENVGGLAAMQQVQFAPSEDPGKEWHHTVIVVSGKVSFVNVEIVVLVQLPKLAVDHVEMLIGKVLCHLVYIFFIF